MNKIFTPRVRKYIYAICIALVPVLIYFKLLPADAAPVILPLVLAITNIQEDPAPTVTTFEPDPHMAEVVAGVQELKEQVRNLVPDPADTGDGR
jgi:hypothetical protein